MMTRIFVSQPVHESALARLTAIAAVTSNPDSRQILPRDQLIAGVRGCDILFSLLHDRIDREVIEANPDLRAIASMSITPDNIDVAAATARGIPVTVVPALAVESTADTHFALLLAVARRVVEGDQLVRSGIFPGSQANYLLGSGVYGKTIGLVGGRGRIGRAVAARAKGFSMRILYCGPHPMEKAEEEALGAVYVPLDRLLAEADFVSLHPSLTDETRHMIDARAGADEEATVPDQHGPRRRRRRGGARRRALGEAHRRRRPRRVRERAGNQPGAQEASQRDNDAAFGQCGLRGARGHGQCRGGQYRGPVGRTAAAEHRQ